MLILEFAAQGIRGVTPQGGRATLRPGYNVVGADGAALRRLLEALLYPGPGDLEGQRAGSGPGTGAVRGGLTLVGQDRVTYRLVRDFGAGAQLHRFDPARRSFALVSQELGEIARFLRASIGVPSPERWGTLLTLSPAELPSRAGGAGLGGVGLGGVGLGPAGAPDPGPRAAPSPDQARRRVEELRLELEKARVAEKLQFQLDGLQSRLFKLEEALKSGQRVQDGLAAAQAERAAVEPVAQAAASLGDPEAALEAYQKALARHAEATARVGQERQALDAAGEAGPPRPFWQDPQLWAGVAAGVLALAVGVAGAVARSELRYLALLGIGGFGWGAWVAYRWVGSWEAWERSTRRRRVVDDWERKLEEQMARDGAEVRRVMAALGLTKPDELREQLQRLAHAEAGVAEWNERLAEWRADAQTSDALAERGTVEEEMRSVETRLASEAGGFVRDVRTVETELARAEAGGEDPIPVAPAAVTPAAPARPPAPAGGEPLRGLLERAAGELGGSPASVARALAQKASQALSGLTLNRLTGVGSDDRGNVQVTSGGRPVPAMTLPPGDRDLVYLALKLALLEQAVATGRSVAVVEDAFAGLSDGARRTSGRLLKALARAGQVVHATTDPAFRESADHLA